MLMANCRGRLREAAARGSPHPLDDVPFDSNRFVPRPVEQERCECACHLDASDGGEAMEEAVRVALLGCERWELVIAKCAPGERRVVAFNERIELTW